MPNLICSTAALGCVPSRLSGLSGGDPVTPLDVTGFGHRRCSLTLEVQGTLSLTNLAGGVAGATSFNVRCWMFDVRRSIR